MGILWAIFLRGKLWAPRGLTAASQTHPLEEDRALAAKSRQKAGLEGELVSSFWDLYLLALLLSWLPLDVLVVLKGSQSKKPGALKRAAWCHRRSLCSASRARLLWEVCRRDFLLTLALFGWCPFDSSIFKDEFLYQSGTFLGLRGDQFLLWEVCVARRAEGSALGVHCGSFSCLWVRGGTHSGEQLLRA